MTPHEKYRALLESPIIEGNNLDVIRQLRRDGLSAIHAPSLIYLDPPFNTGKKQTGTGGLSFSDPLCDVRTFAGELSELAKELWSMLPMQGSLVVHLDWRTVHYAKVHLDQALGFEHFASEIIWRYRRWPAKTANFQRIHDTLLRYVKCPGEQTWNQLYEPSSASTLATWGTGKQRAVVADGKRKRSSTTDETSPGVPMGDVWEISIVAPVAKERTGYPTQKPEALLERLILATTNPGDLVLDPCCGSGTTVAVARRLGRVGIGIDSNPQAVEVSRRRISTV
jgi:DNA modification methylase